MDRRKLDKQNLDNSSLDMSKRSISDFKPIINVILSNPSTRRVDLSDNCITQLPKDLSMLKEVYEINLIDNELSPFESAVVALSTVPSLTHLHLNLHEEQQVDFVIKTLPNLLVLNGEDIDREELQNESESEHRFEAEQQDTNNNEIKQIKELEEEDELSENHIKNIANDKRNSEIINSSCTGSDILNYSDSEEISLKPQDLETVALIFDKIRNMHRKNKLSNDKEMANEFDKHLKTCMQKLSDIVTAENTTINVKNSAILRTKFDLGEICHEKAMQYLNKKDKNIGKVYSKTYQIHSEIITDYDRLYTALANRYEEKKLQNSSLSKEIEQLKAELNNAKIERAAVLDIGENIEKQMQAKQIDYEKSLQSLHEEYKSQIQLLDEKVRDVEIQNDKLLEKLVKFTKDKSERLLSSSPLKAESEAKAREEMEIDRKRALEIFSVGISKKGELIGNTNIRILTLKQLKDIIREIYEHKERHDEKCKRTKLPLETMEQFMFTFLNQKYGLKNLIIEWAASIVNGVKCYMKEDSDVSLFAKILKNEIEEDFRYIQDKVKTTVSNVLKKYIKEKHKHKREPEINAMLRDIEEGHIGQSSGSCNYILDFIYEAEDKEKIKEMLFERKKLVFSSNGLYSNRGRNVTPPKVSSAKGNFTTSPISYRAKDLTPNSRLKTPRSKLFCCDDGESNERQEEMYNKVMQEKDFNKILFKDLLFCICEYQIRQHEKYLNRFVTLFKSADNDRDGIINEEKFKYLIKEMKIIPLSIATSEEKLEEEIERLLVMIDPHKTQRITFSQLVTFLTLTEYNEAGPNKDLNGIADSISKRIFDDQQQNDEERSEDKQEASQNTSMTLLDKINEVKV